MESDLESLRDGIAKSTRQHRPNDGERFNVIQVTEKKGGDWQDERAKRGKSLLDTCLRSLVIKIRSAGSADRAAQLSKTGHFNLPQPQSF